MIKDTVSAFCNTASRAQMSKHESEAGFTLLEFMLALFIAGALGTLVLQLYPFVMRYMVTWEDRVTLENQVHLTVRRMALDAMQADQVVEMDPYTWALHRAGQPTITYHWAGDSLMRNEQRMLISSFRVVEASYQLVDLHTSYAPRPKDLGEEADPTKRLRITVSLKVASPRDTLALETTVLSLRVRPWQSLRP